jgi:hypothetical protein
LSKRLHKTIRPVNTAIADPLLDLFAPTLRNRLTRQVDDGIRIFDRPLGEWAGYAIPCFEPQPATGVMTTKYRQIVSHSLQAANNCGSNKARRTRQTDIHAGL